MKNLMELHKALRGLVRHHPPSLYYIGQTYLQYLAMSRPSHFGVFSKTEPPLEVEGAISTVWLIFGFVFAANISWALKGPYKALKGPYKALKGPYKAL